MTTYLIQPGKSGGFKHRTGGKRKEKCPLCGKQLISLLIYDVTDERINWGLNGVHEIPLVYCFACDLWEMAYMIKGDAILVRNGDGIDDDNEIKLMDSTEVVFENVPTDLQYESQDYEDWYLKKGLGNVPQPFPHIGSPYAILNELNQKTCCVCNAEMAFVAALYDTKKIRFDLNMTMSQIVYTYCRRCAIIHAAIHST